MNTKPVNYTVNREGWESSDGHYRVVNPSTGNLVEFPSWKEALSFLMSGPYYKASYEIEQRYTDQQIELLRRNEKWEVGKWKECPINYGLVIDNLRSEEEENGSYYISNSGLIDWRFVSAYRLTNNDLYCEGKRVKLKEGDWTYNGSLSGEELIYLCQLISDAGLVFDQDKKITVISSGSVNKRVRQLTVPQILNAENAKLKEEQLACCVACNHEWRTYEDVNEGPCPRCGDVIENDKPNEFKDCTIKTEGVETQYSGGVVIPAKDVLTELADTIAKELVDEKANEVINGPEPTSLSVDVKLFKRDELGDWMEDEETPWDGKGLPPVGFMCEGYILDETSETMQWEVVEPLKHFEEDSECAVYVPSTQGLAFCDQFRLMRTPQQQAVFEILSLDLTKHDDKIKLEQIISDIYNTKS